MRAPQWERFCGFDASLPPMSSIAISEFYDYGELTERLEELAATAPDLLSLSSIGESREGRNIWCVTAANEAAGPPVERRSALLVTANMHARELAGSWVALHLLRHLVENYGEDEHVTRLLDEQAFYVVPRVAPDGTDYVLDTRSKKVRSRHIDVDHDDVDPDVVVPGDADGDGSVLTMRWPDEDGGKARLDDERLLVARADEETGGEFYRSVREGVVPRREGGPISEANLRSDFNRNFPSSAWEPFEWTGHGKYPLSEPETEAVAEFVYDHPNVTGVADLHTGNPALFYPRATIEGETDYPADAELIERLGERGEELTGFPFLSSYAEARGEETQGELPGSFKDFVYERIGVPAFVVELGMFYNYLGMETSDLGMPRHEHEREWSRRLIDWHDANPEYGLFHDWEAFDHPDLGEVEIGGWDWVLWSNPPVPEMEGVAEGVTEFLLEYADWTPDVSVETSVEPVGEDLYRVESEVRNGGRVPTNVTERGPETVVDERPRVDLRSAADVEVVAGRSRQRIDHLDTRETATLEWVVRAPAGATLDVAVTAPRGVYATDRLTPGE